MKHRRTVLLQRALTWVLGAGLSLSASYAMADMLPMVVDQTAATQTHYWWSSSTPNANGVVSQHLFSEDVSGVVRPSRLHNFAVSRIYQRPDISVGHAQEVARMTGATSFFLGVARAETQRVGWLSSSSAIVTIQGELFDTRSGARLGEIEILGRGVSTHPQQALEIAAKSAARDLVNFQPRGHRTGVASLSPFEVVIRTPGAADAFVRLRDHLARSIEGQGELGECRASEGEVVLCVRALPGQDAALVRASVVQSLRASFTDIVMEELREEEQRVFVHARMAPATPSHGDGPRLPF